MWTGVQFTGSLNAGQQHRWFTWGWPPDWHVVWYMMPASPAPGAPQIDWDVQVERANPTQCTYWITVKNNSAQATTFDARFAVLN